MNITKIEWADATLNPVVGCGYGCNFCYARKQAKRQRKRCMRCYEFVVHEHLERLKQLTPKQKPRTIFIDSMWDWNSIEVKDEWIHAILAKMKECSQHVFLILSKQPSMYGRFKYPPNVLLGTSISTNRDIYRLFQIHNLYTFKADNPRFVSIEPIHEDIKFWFSRIDWIIIGAETGHRKNKVIPKKRWVERIIKNARAENIPLFLKDSLKWNEVIREYPTIMKAF